MATETALSLRSSLPPKEHSAQATLGLVPIELENGCTEDGCTFESDDAHLTNVIRQHYLAHFGHRDLEGVISDYADGAVLINVVNGVRSTYKGKEDIRKYFEDIFKSHPTTKSTFQLKDVVVDHNHGMAVWAAKTPTAAYPHCSDTLVFNSSAKIIKHFCNCQMNKLEVPWQDKD